MTTVDPAPSDGGALAPPGAEGWEQAEDSVATLSVPVVGRPALSRCAE